MGLAESSLPDNNPIKIMMMKLFRDGKKLSVCGKLKKDLNNEKME
jgi:hypothetical protein